MAALLDLWRAIKFFHTNSWLLNFFWGKKKKFPPRYFFCKRSNLLFLVTYYFLHPAMAMSLIRPTPWDRCGESDREEVFYLCPNNETYARFSVKNAHTQVTLDCEKSGGGTHTYERRCCSSFVLCTWNQRKKTQQMVAALQIAWKKSQSVDIYRIHNCLR